MIAHNTPVQGEWSEVSSRGTIPPYYVSTKPIEKSDQDDREYRVIQLRNGLQATVVHDPKADKAAASLDVAVGNMNDPDDMPGLAHFCEHLLFMGTTRFPRENEYSEFVTKNSGYTNAYTSTTNTNYYFNISTSALKPALSRFSAFFHCPLFAPSCTSRELNAVDSENKKNLQSDRWRIFQLNRHLAKESNPWNRFGSGNRESLSKAARDLKFKGMLNGKSPVHMNGDAEAVVDDIDLETRRRVVEWWEKEYCASRMRVCVIGKEPLDELADTVSDLFSPVVNRGRDPVPMFHDHPFGPNEMGTLVSVQTIMSFHAVEISFPLDYQPLKWRYKPAHFIAHFVGHEGPGSLLSYLKNKGWVTSLNSGAQDIVRGYGMFKVTIHMTAEGFQHYREVVLATFKYLSLLRSTSFPSWMQREESILSKIQFRFQEKRRPSDYAAWISEHMIWPVPRELILTAPQTISEWDDDDCEKEIREYLASFRIDRGRSVLMARKEEHERVMKANSPWETEPWYGTQYRVERWDDEFIRLAQGDNDIEGLYLPGPNEFIPTNLNVDKRDVLTPLMRPHLIRKTAMTELWHKKDDQFWLPKATVIMDIRSPVPNISPRTDSTNRIFSDLVNDALTELSYDADLAGLTWMCRPHSVGLWISISGYNDKLAVLAQHVLDKVRNLEVKEDRLEVIKEQLIRNWENFSLGSTYQLTDYFGRYLLTRRQYTIAEKLKEVPSLTVQEIQHHAKALLSKVKIHMLVMGNMYKDEAMRLAEMTETILNSSPCPSSETADEALILHEGSNFVWSAPVTNPNDVNSGITYYVHIGNLDDPRLRVVGAILAHLLDEPAFNTLRTKEQLGYTVFCSQWELTGSRDFGVRILIMSERGPVFLEKRIEAFLESMGDRIRDMTSEDFEEHKAGLEKKWREAAKNLTEESFRYWNLIDSGSLDFFRRHNDADLIRTILKDEVLALFHTRIHPSAPSRAKLSVHLHSQKPRPERVSTSAAQAFKGLVESSGVTLNEEIWQKQGQLPTRAQFTDFCKGVFTQMSVPAEISQDILSKLPSLIAQHPAEDEGDETKSGATLIEDMNVFRSSLKISANQKPVVQWDDLPVPKF